MKSLSILICFLFFTAHLFSQTDIEPSYLIDKKYLKKEKGKYGLYNKAENKWIIEPLYDKITSISFTPKQYDFEMGDGGKTVYFNLMFYKLWKGNTFDLLYVSDDKKNIYNKNFELWVNDVTEIIFPAFKPAAASLYNTKDLVNFIYYKKNGKWGWFANEFFIAENILHAPVFDKPPVARLVCENDFHDYFNNYVIETDTAGLTALYTLKNNLLVPPGKYKNIIIKASDYIITENENGLKGYNRVAPQFKSVERTVFKSYVTITHFLVTMPDNTRRVLKEDGKILSDEEVLQESKINKEIAAFANYLSTTKTIAGSIIFSVKPDHSGVITNMYGKEVNIPFEFGEYITDRRTYSFKINGQWEAYYEMDNKVTKYNYALHSDEQSYSWPMLAVWPDDNTVLPIVLATKNDQLIMINCLTDKRKELPLTLTNDGVFYENKFYKFYLFRQYDEIQFTRTDTTICSHCTKGYNTEEKEVITKAHKEYETVKVTGYKNETESTWNPTTNSYQYVTTPKQVSSYEQIAIEVPEKREIETISVRCKHCDGKYLKVNTHTLVWNGKEFELRTE